MTIYTAICESFIGMNEADLVLAAQEGDLEAFNQMVMFYQSKIFALALRILGDEDSAEDITQNTFLTAYLKLHCFSKWFFPQLAISDHYQRMH